jgi:formate-dependent phosphoribosylglycinamide formyltransferase (GAR transformylase)
VIAVTDKAKAGAPYFTERGQLVPSRDSGNAQLRQTALDACAALEIDRGLAHVEVLVNGEQLSVVEVAARPGGDGIMDLVDRVYGFSPYDLHIASYLGPFTGFPEFPTQARGVGATTFLKALVGTVSAVHPVDDLTDEECALYTTAKVGDWSRPATSYLARDGVLECFKADATDDEIADYRAHVDELARTRTGQLFSVTAELE